MRYPHREKKKRVLSNMNKSTNSILTTTFEFERKAIPECRECLAYDFGKADTNNPSPRQWKATHSGAFANFNFENEVISSTSLMTSDFQAAERAEFFIRKPSLNKKHLFEFTNPGKRCRR